MPQKFQEYAYDPSSGAAIVAIICFCLTTALHTWQLVRTHSWSFIPLTTGGYRKYKRLPSDLDHFEYMLTATLLNSGNHRIRLSTRVVPPES